MGSLFVTIKWSSFPYMIGRMAFVMIRWLRTRTMRNFCFAIQVQLLGWAISSHRHINREYRANNSLQLQFQKAFDVYVCSITFAYNMELSPRKLSNIQWIFSKGENSCGCNDRIAIISAIPLPQILSTFFTWSFLTVSHRISCC